MASNRVVGAVVALLGLVAIGCIVAVIVVTVVLTDKIDTNDSEQPMSTGSGTSQQMGGDHMTNMMCDDVQDVAIVGAGISGSYAAWRMRNSNMKVSLFELCGRIGGRFHTVRFSGIPDVNVELGSMRFIPEIAPKLNKTLYDLGMDVIDFQLGFGSSGSTRYFLRGKHLTQAELANNAPYDIPDALKVDPTTLAWELFKNFTDVDPTMAGYTSYPDKLHIKSTDGIPLYRQSRRSYNHKYVSSEVDEYLKAIEVWDSYYVDVAAAVGLPRTDPSQPAGPASSVKTVSEGFQAIPEKMVEQFKEAGSNNKFYNNHHLRAVKKNKEGYYVLEFQPTRTVRGVTQDDLTLVKRYHCAKKVLLAIPRIALENLDWDGFKHPEIMDYLKNSVIDATAGKMYFAYSDTWWRDLPLKSPFVISTTPLRQTYDFGVSSSGRGVLNIAYPDLYTKIWRDAVKQGNKYPGVDGEDGVAVTDVAVDLARKRYADIMGIPVDDVKKPDYAVMDIWDMYPYGGAWHVWRPGYVWENVAEKMQKPSATDDVFIISNTFTMMNDWAEGGLQVVDSTLEKYFDMPN